ncbi:MULTISPECIES: hypothetical protein [Rhizobium]|uniref:Four helix bundle protein n=1 Tax=Rhizobium paranaense TaxID=1650438 RepID=A0A7W8XTE6_9HYPH|nr:MULTISPECIES: hypothetical protein [Rhizobium]MBB5575171.1 hypothetical protein [Rhizobium paranaense]PST64404.1 hypothetical protein C9E91_02650 [Rhizobium sp. SEMIA4064]
MHIEHLLAEVRILAERFSPIAARGKICGEGDAPDCESDRGLLNIALSCSRISDISSRIAKAGYWECEREMLMQIGAQSRNILYSINELRRSLELPQP